MTEYFFQIFNRNGTRVWHGNALDETAAWKQAKIELKYPDAYPIEQMTGGRNGLRICSWEI